MRVREATIGDLEVIADLITEEAREAEGRVLEREILELGIGAALKDNSIAKYWLLTDDFDVVCGCTSVVKEWSDWNAGFYWWIQSMYVTPGHRGKGCLRILVDAVVEAARAEKCLELRLYVHKQNQAAVRAYRKAGFTDSPYLIMSQSV